MPLANIYVSENSFVEQLTAFTSALAEEIARELSVIERKLTPGEVSVRILDCKPGSKMIAPIEMEITAHRTGLAGA